uniref:Uncharacterized protein n=1 Tax=Glossina palpalis gambiensis TaxID=67801 RepID=A0A1B0B1V1_9MUSC
MQVNLLPKIYFCVLPMLDIHLVLNSHVRMYIAGCLILVCFFSSMSRKSSRNWFLIAFENRPCFNNGLILRSVALRAIVALNKSTNFDSRYKLQHGAALVK